MSVPTECTQSEVVANPAPLSRASGYLPTLDGWRAVAILLVMLSHLAGNLFGPLGLAPDEQARALAERGNFGVDIFFCISGLLITTRLLAEQSERGRIDIRGFYLRRAFRILPVAWAFLLVWCMLCALGVTPFSPLELVLSLCFTRNFIVGGWYTGHLWSLAIEEQFYLFWPALLVLLSPRRALPGTAVLLLSLLLWKHHNNIDVKDWTTRTDFRLDEILVGALAGLWLDSLPGRAVRARLANWRLLVPLALSLAAAAWVVPHLGLFVPLFSTLVLVSTVVQPDSLLGRILERPIVRKTGILSYSLYIWQQLFLVAREPDLRSAFLQRLPVNLVLAFAAAYLSYRYLEKPLIRLGHRWSKPLTGRPEE